MTPQAHCGGSTDETMRRLPVLLLQQRTRGDSRGGACVVQWCRRTGTKVDDEVVERELIKCRSTLNTLLSWMLTAETVRLIPMFHWRWLRRQGGCSSCSGSAPAERIPACACTRLQRARAYWRQHTMRNAKDVKVSKAGGMKRANHNR